MTTLQEQIAEAERKHAKQIAELQQEHAVREALSVQVPGLEAYEAPRIYSTKLYGAVGWITFKHTRAEVLRKQGTRQPDRALLALLLDRLPGRPITKFADGCLSFPPTQYVEGLSDEKVSRAELTPAAPWLIEADPNHFSDTVEVLWYAEIGGQLWRIGVEFPRYSCQIGRWDIVLKHTRYGEIDHVDRCELRPDFPEAPEPPQRVRWGSGHHTSLNKFTLWWYDSEPDVLAHIQRGILAAVPEGKAAPHV